MKKNASQKQRLNYQQRVMATPLKLASTEVDRAHKSTYFALETLNKYQKTFLEREYNKFWYDKSIAEATKRIDEEMRKIKMNVHSLRANKDFTMNQHFVVYEYQDKLYLTPRIIYRYRNLFKKVSNGAVQAGHMDTAGILICPHSLARMMHRSHLEWDQAIKILGLFVLEYAKSQIDPDADNESKLFPFSNDLIALEKIIVKDFGEMRSESITLDEPLLCNGEQMLPAGRTLTLFKTWISY